MLKIDGSLAGNIDFEVANFAVPRKTRRKASISKLRPGKIGGNLARNAFDASRCVVSRLWLSCGLTMSMRETAKPLLVEGVKAGCHVVLHGKGGAS